MSSSICVIAAFSRQLLRQTIYQMSVPTPSCPLSQSPPVLSTKTMPAWLLTMTPGPQRAPSGPRAAVVGVSIRKASGLHREILPQKMRGGGRGGERETERLTDWAG